MNLDRFSVPKEVFGLINSVDRDEEQDLLLCAVMRYIYDHNEQCASALTNRRAILAFERIKDILDKPLARARKAKERREDKKAHPEKHPPRKSARCAKAVQLPSGHIIESDTPYFDYYCVKGNKIFYFRLIGSGDVKSKKATFDSAFDEPKPINAILQLLAKAYP